MQGLSCSNNENFFRLGGKMEMTLTPEMFEMMWAGVFIAVKFLGGTALWCLACGIINKSIGG